MTLDADGLEAQITEILFTSLEEMPGIVSIVRSEGGWTVDEHEVEDDDDRLLTGEVTTTLLKGTLWSQLDRQWPDMVSGVDVEGLDAQDAIAYLNETRAAVVMGDGLGIAVNGRWCESDGERLVPEEEDEPS